MQTSLFDTDPHTIARASDPATSKAAAHAVAYRTGTHKANLLAAYAAAYPDGLTDEEAATIAGLVTTGYWKRCSDLRNDGRITPLLDSLGAPITRVASSGQNVIVCIYAPTNGSAGATSED